MDTALLAQKLVSWLQEKVLAAGCRGTVFGMSGGLDSSVVALLCQRAIPQNTLGVIMPCHSNPEDMKHAQEVAKQFSIPTETVVLDTIFDTLLKVLPGESESATSRLAEANLKARLRMPILYYMANQLQYLVAGASNRNELAIGYFTKYGDAGADILPLGNLVKGEVKELASYLKIPQTIIDKPPSAGLWAGQTDEDEMSISYEVFDRYLLTGHAPDELKSKIESMIAASDHKRSLPPIARF